MERPNHNAQERLRERAFTLWEEASTDSGERYNLWHRLRPLLSQGEPPVHHAVAGDAKKAKNST